MEISSRRRTKEKNDMINLQINFRNPWRDRFANIQVWHGSTIIKNKFWELQIYKSSDIFDMFVRLTHRQSHAGIHLGLGLFGYNIEFQIYDARHWNKNTENWETY